jgi:egghead protein (zeste-white 4 protein)
MSVIQLRPARQEREQWLEIVSTDISTYTPIPEPKRDWSFGFITGHRVRYIAMFVTIFVGLYLLQDYLWPSGKQPSTTLDLVWSAAAVIWLSGVIPGFLGVLGMLAYRHPEKLDDERPIDTPVYFRIVSRGDNVEVLTDTVRRCQTEMEKHPLFPYRIEVVVDSYDFFIAAPNDDVTVIRVPDDYRTPKNTRFKARGLQYALDHSKAPDHAWLVHLDEETQPTSSGIKGICRFVREQEASGEHRIGQGAILYHRQWKQHPFLTLADNVRTGDDFARFHFQHRLGVTVFGLHGSYIVVRNDIEKSIGFDFGPKGEITEDAFWAMVAMEKGHRCAWVEGYLEEQSCQSILDFMKQRRRWWQGLMLVSLYAPVKFRWRACITINTLLWALAPLSMLYTIAHFFYGFETNPVVRFGANFAFASFLVLYLVGLRANLDEHGVTNPFKRAFWWVAQTLALPLCSLMESMSVLWAIVKPAKGFHVIKK